jgi:hypothetical protein
MAVVGNHKNKVSQPRPMMATKRTFGVWFFFLLCTLAFAPWMAPAQSAPKEYQLKAAFLFNFAQFVEWPQTAFANANSPFCIGVVGDNSFGTVLDEIVKGETIQGHKLTARHSKKIEDLKDCQIIFISKSEKGRTTEILSQLNSLHVLTVSETAGFAQHGGVINFYLEGTKVRFEINPAVARREGLKLGSELITLGKIVETEPNQENK